MSKVVLRSHYTHSAVAKRHGSVKYMVETDSSKQGSAPCGRAWSRRSPVCKGCATSVDALVGVFGKDKGCPKDKDKCLSLRQAKTSKDSAVLAKDSAVLVKDHL